MGYDDPVSLSDHLSLEDRVVALEAAIKGLQLRLGDAERRLESVDPGSESIDPRPSMSPVGQALWDTFSRSP